MSPIVLELVHVTRRDVDELRFPLVGEFDTLTVLLTHTPWYVQVVSRRPVLPDSFGAFDNPVIFQDNSGTFPTWRINVLFFSSFDFESLLG